MSSLTALTYLELTNYQLSGSCVPPAQINSVMPNLSDLVLTGNFLDGSYAQQDHMKLDPLAALDLCVSP